MSTSNNKTVIKSFSGATTKDMKCYIKPTMEKDPDRIILHSGTNDLKGTADANTIAESIVELAASMKKENNMVVIYSIIPRRDKLNLKAKNVNEIVERMCTERSIDFIQHFNIKPHIHCNRSGLHLNQKGNDILKNNFLRFLNKASLG